MIDKLRDLGYRVEWSQGATPEPLRDKHRENGWAWEGDTHAHHDGEPMQHDDHEAPGYVAPHRVLRDDSDQPTIWFVEGPVKDGGVGEPTGYEHQPEDGEAALPIVPLIAIYVREDDEEVWQSLVDSHGELLAELEQRESETPRQTAERHAREVEERAAEEA